ncbi:hypothetical protein BC829DRAFT_421879 [Chytridium lagenaria]|nr:hypothetical protein BC829DRAFT_421879 [Chytridium lagenaria]
MTWQQVTMMNFTMMPTRSLGTPVISRPQRHYRASSTRNASRSNNRLWTPTKAFFAFLAVSLFYGGARTTLMSGNFFQRSVNAKEGVNVGCVSGGVGMALDKVLNATSSLAIHGADLVVWSEAIVIVDDGDVVGRVDSVFDGATWEIGNLTAKLNITVGHLRVAAIIGTDVLHPRFTNALTTQDVDIVVMPAADWGAYGRYGWRNAVVKGLESGVSVVRCASRGISGAVTAYGEVVGYREVGGDLETGIVRVPMRRRVKTWYAGFGWVMGWGCMGFSWWFWSVVNKHVDII